MAESQENQASLLLAAVDAACALSPHEDAPSFGMAEVRSSAEPQAFSGKAKSF